MPETITFRGARIRYVDLRRDDEAGVFARIHLTADYSDPVRDEMGWEPIPATLTAGKLIGRLSAQHLVLTPTDDKLCRSEIQMECSEVTDFQLAPLKSDGGEVIGHELRFICRTIDPTAISLLDNYLRVIGGGTANLRVAYVEQAAFEAEPSAQLELMPNAETPGLDDEPEAQDDGPALASAVQVAGNTDNLKRARRNRQSRNPIPADPGSPERRTAEEIAEGVPRHIDRSVQ